MDSRVNSLGVSQAEIATQGSNQIVASLPDVHDIKRAENEVGSTAQLEFYDWEANALTPAGKPVASQLALRNPDALTISQGTSGAPPGEPGYGRRLAVQRGQAGLRAAAGPVEQGAIAQGQSVLPVRRSGIAGVHGRGQGPRDGPGQGPVVLFGGPQRRSHDR